MPTYAYDSSGSCVTAFVAVSRASTAGDFAEFASNIVLIFTVFAPNPSKTYIVLL